MTKKELTKEIAKITDYEPYMVERVIDIMAKVIKNNCEDNPVFIRGFGAFTHKHRAQKKARIITEKRAIIIPAHNVPYFKPYFKL